MYLHIHQCHDCRGAISRQNRSRRTSAATILARFGPCRLLPVSESGAGGGHDLIPLRVLKKKNVTTMLTTVISEEFSKTFDNLY